MILMLWVPDGEREREDELILAKNREGETGYPNPGSLSKVADVV